MAVLNSNMLYMMDTIQWLERNADGFKDLSQQERSAPMHFSLLWSYFEAEALNANGSASSIEYWLRDLDRRGKLNAAAFASALTYFKDRYFSNGLLTNNFHDLRLRPNDNPHLVTDVISGQDVDSTNGVVALFIVIYRFRNNYFHGPKWAYQLQDQLNNFTTANESIMAVIEMSRE